MPWFIRFLKWVSWAHRVIPDRLDPSQPYLTRWYLLGGPKHRWFTLCLHEFHMSDPTDLHDHPFSYLTLILSGGYWEETPEGMYWRGPGHVRFRPAKSRHRIELSPYRTPVYTLFLMGPRTRDWGFIKQGTWIDHLTYLDSIATK